MSNPQRSQSKVRVLAGSRTSSCKLLHYLNFFFIMQRIFLSIQRNLQIFFNVICILYRAKEERRIDGKKTISSKNKLVVSQKHPAWFGIFSHSGKLGMHQLSEKLFTIARNRTCVLATQRHECYLLANQAGISIRKTVNILWEGTYIPTTFPQAKNIINYIGSKGQILKSIFPH